MTRNTTLLLGKWMLLLCLALVMAESARAEEPRSVARRLVESNGQVITFVMHPTSKLLKVEYDGQDASASGFVLKYTYHYSHLLGDFHSRMSFHFDDQEKFKGVTTRSTTALTAPFFGSDLAMDFLKDIVADELKLSEHGLLKMALKAADSRSALGLYLLYRQSTTKVEGPSDAELMSLMRGSESMDDKERAEWTNLLPRMNASQRTELKKILVNERQSLAAIDAKYKALEGGLTKAIQLMRSGDFDQAIAVLNPVAEQHPKDASVLLLRGQAYYGAAKHQSAIKDFTEVIRLSPGSARAYSLRASAAQKLGNHRQAYLDYHRLVELRPDDPSSCNGVAWLLATCPEAKFRDGKEAIKFAKKACELTQWKQPLYFDTLAAAYAEDGQFDLAVEWQTKALADLDAFTKAVGEEEARNAQRRLQLFKSRKSYQE